MVISWLQNQAVCLLVAKNKVLCNHIVCSRPKFKWANTEENRVYQGNMSDKKQLPIMTEKWKSAKNMVMHVLYRAFKTQNKYLLHNELHYLSPVYHRHASFRRWMSKYPITSTHKGTKSHFLSNIEYKSETVL